jgi:DNA repair protein SbcD/Mre11
MRILHTSDWHLGRNFGPVSLLADQADFVDWMVGVCATEQVDLVVVAGDVYDRAIPPTEAVVLFREALVRLQAAGHVVAVITGNHDGADRVAAYDELMDASRVYIRGGYSKVGEVVPLEFADGPLDLVMLPFLDPQAAPDSLAAAPGDDSDDAYERRLRRTHQSVLAAAVEAAAPQRRGVRSLAVSHAFVVGGETSESERQLSVGGSGTVDMAVFSSFSYAALGHLHRPQQLAPTVRYSGTPLAYSFSEAHQKSVTLVDLAADGACTVREVKVPVGRAVLTVEGQIDELLRHEPTAAQRESLVRAVITDGGVVLDAKPRLSQVYPHVVEIVLRPPMAAGGVGGGAAVDRRVVSATEAADSFWVASTGTPPTPEQAELLHTAITVAEGKVA